MLALSGLVLATMLLSTPAAHAGSWTYTLIGDNGDTGFTDNGMPGYVPPFPSGEDADGHPIVYPGYIAGLPTYTIAHPGNESGGTGCDINITAHVQVTFTWVPDPNLPSDPPPDKVWVLESATAFWSASAGDSQHLGYFSGSSANGLWDPEYDPPNNPFSYPPTIYQSAYSGLGYSGPPPDQSYLVPSSLAQHFQSYDVSNGMVTVAQRTLTANATTSYANFNQWYYGAKASVSYSASIHPTPYNFRRVNHYGGTPPTSSVLVGAGDLKFYYQWSSTSGYLADDGTHPDLSGIEIHENVDAPPSPLETVNGTVYYAPDNPPFVALELPHFDGTPVMANGPAIEDNHTWGSDSLASSFDKKTGTNIYPVDSFNLTQTYKFYDPDIMTAGVEQIIPGNAGPFTIKEAVIADSNSPSGFSYQVTKDSVPSLPIPLP